MSYDLHCQNPGPALSPPEPEFVGCHFCDKAVAFAVAHVVDCGACDGSLPAARAWSCEACSRASYLCPGSARKSKSWRRSEMGEAVGNVRYLPSAAARVIAELEQRLEAAEFAAKKNAETVAGQALHIRAMEGQVELLRRDNALLAENSSIARIIRENAADFLTALFESADDVLVPVKETLMRCPACGTLVHYAARCVKCERDRVPVDVTDKTPLSRVLADFNTLTPRQLAELLIGYAMGETRIEIRCGECGERNSECVGCER